MKKLATLLLVLAMLVAGAALGWNRIPDDYRRWVRGNMPAFTSAGEYEAKAVELPHIDVVPVEGESKLEMIDVTTLREHRYRDVSIRLPWEKPEEVIEQEQQVTLVFPQQTQVVITDPKAATNFYEQLQAGGVRGIEAGERFFEALHVNSEKQLMEKMLNVTAESFRNTRREEKQKALLVLARLKSSFLEMMPGEGPPRRFEVDQRTAWVFGDPAAVGNATKGPKGAAVEMVDAEGHHLEFYLHGSEVELQTLIATAKKVD